MDGFIFLELYQAIYHLFTAIPFALLLRILGELGNVWLRVEILAYFSLRPQQRIQVLV